jgi:hypothetical protein
MSLSFVAMLGVACGPRIEIRTMAAPNAGLAALQTFRMLPPPVRRDNQPITGEDDPMINNSIANRAIRERIVKAFVARGYARNDRSPDFGVAFYATSREHLDATIWDYGYPFNPRWGRLGLPGTSPSTAGSVVIDVVRWDTKELLWRGVGTAHLGDDANKNVSLLGDAVDEIIGNFPAATIRKVAERP